ncbi:MAG: winged helix-turn-helix domain-containing protein [Candidatus Limnocylindrales bacterium]
MGRTMAIEISIKTARRYVLGRQGLWPGRRWRGLDGTEQAMRAIEHLQLDPLVVVARAHDLILQGRVIDYRQDDWATLTYGQRKFFDWGGWLAVRPMDELPYWRVLMRREIDLPNWVAFRAEHAAAIAEMREVLRERGEVANRDFEMGDRTRVDHYRGRKDSSLALHYLWRIGDVMVSRRERFERVYALTESVAPAELLREHDAAEADDYLLMKTVAAEGLTPMRTVTNALRRTVPPAELAAWRERKIAGGHLVEVRVEGWRTPQVALAEDGPVLHELATGGVPTGWEPLDTTTDDEVTFLAPLDPVSARGRAKPLFDFDYVWEVYKPAHLRRWGYYTLPILWGDRLVARFDSKLDRTSGTLVINGLWLEDQALARDDAFAEALRRGMSRFAGFLDAGRVDAAAVPQLRLRRRLSARRIAVPR